MGVEDKLIMEELRKLHPDLSPKTNFKIVKIGFVDEKVGNEYVICFKDANSEEKEGDKWIFPESFIEERGIRENYPNKFCAVLTYTDNVGNSQFELVKISKGD